MKNIDLRVWEDNWNENGLPLKSEFHDFTTQPGIKEGVNAALRMVDAGQLQDKFPLAAAQALQKVHNSLNAAARQPQVENNTLYQIGELIKSAAPLIGQALGAVMGGTGAEGQAGGAANEVAGTAALGAAMPAAQPIPELRTFEHRIGDGSGMPDNPIHWGTDELPQLTPVSASGSATDFSGGAGGSGSVGGIVGNNAGPSTGGTAGPSAGPVAGPSYGADSAPISAPGGEEYPGGETLSGGAGFGDESLPSGGGYPGGDFPYIPSAGFSGQRYGTWQESGPITPSPEGMYVPMYPVPGILTTEPQGEVSPDNSWSMTGEAEREWIDGMPQVQPKEGITSEAIDDKSPGQAPSQNSTQKPKLYTNENGDFEVVMVEDNTMPPKGWSEVTNVDDLDDSALTRMGKALALAGMGVVDITMMPIKGLGEAYGNFLKSFVGGGTNPLIIFGGSANLMKDKYNWARHKLPNEVKEFGKRMELRKRNLGIN